ncbi:MAG: hypothetical protein NC307_12130 [Roseburia sp.]|nr:hypothetical protein [Roseburia sp.]
MIIVLFFSRFFFIAYVNELHADFGATEKMANSSRQKLLDSMEYKKVQKIKAKGNDESDPLILHGHKGYIM